MGLQATPLEVPVPRVGRGVRMEGGIEGIGKGLTGVHVCVEARDAGGFGGVEDGYHGLVYCASLIKKCG